ARGHRHIAYLGARLDERTIIKQKGYEQAKLDAGLVPYSVMVEQSSSYSSGIELIRQARREYPQLDGVFCTNDDLAVGAALSDRRMGKGRLYRRCPVAAKIALASAGPM
ncbi:substrate-binding domain-containing protein, partial [Pseudomonas aeruginosa]